MPMRLSGLMSGMDTESIIQQLVEAKKTKVTKAVKAQKSLKYKQDAWKDLNKQILNLYNKSLSNMRFQSSFIKKVTKVSNSSVVSVITGEGAMNSVQSLEVKSLAKSGYLTGGALPETVSVTDEDGVTKNVEVTGKTTLGQLGLASGIGNMQVKVGNEVTGITVDESSTIDDFIQALRTAGVNANFDENNRRIYVASKSSGGKSNFDIYADDAQGFAALNVLKLSYAVDDEGNGLANRYQEIITNIDNNTTLQSRLDYQLQRFQTDWENYRNNRASLLGGLGDLGELGEKVVERINDELTSAGFELKNGDDESGLKLVKTDGTEIELEDIDDESWEKINDAINTVQGKLVDEYNDGSADGSLTEEEQQEIFGMAESLNGWITNQNNLNSTKARFMSDDDGNLIPGADGKPQLAQFVVDNITAQVQQERDDAQAVLDGLNSIGSSGAKKTAGTGAVITLNGETYTSEKNTFEINGLTLTVNARTAANEVVTITTQDDTDGIYDMVKNFFKEYNTLINQMDKLYNADSAKGYDPLTDEEKSAMSDSAIEEWENKIKDSILRKDSTLSTFSQAMKTIMMEGVEVDGQMMYLSNFGIGTLNYFLSAENEKNAYHIDGDPDDENTSGNADKLKSMIANDPDTVVSFFTQLSQKLYDKMFDMMKNVEGYSSSMTAYDDIKMKKDYDDYTTKIKELEDKLADYEDKWYAKFAAMETALAKMQNNASAVMSLLGGS